MVVHDFYINDSSPAKGAGDSHPPHLWEEQGMVWELFGETAQQFGMISWFVFFPNSARRLRSEFGRSFSFSQQRQWKMGFFTFWD